MIEASAVSRELPAKPNDKTVLSHYSVTDSGYDEMYSAPGELRPHWRHMARFLEETGSEELARRQAEIQRLLQSDGVTYNTYDDPHESQRYWSLDPIPLLMTGEEWSTLAAGLEQRSRLLNALLADLYGPRLTIRHGWLPPQLIHAHPGFLPPCHQSLPAGGRWLIFHGVDLARGPDGVFRVYGDRSQSPSGAGYTLENRITLARAMPLLYRDAPLRRLASFLEAERTTLAGMARHNPENPHVVLLTPGPNSPVYFEHAYLANYLSLSLVEGEDLVVRDGRVWLKTLGGLRPVDVILRRVLDAFCDPLELRGDSLLGVPGLLQAARGGHVVIANALGSSLIENPGLATFLPLLCRHLLGEDLKLHSLPTWWCGQASDLSHVLAHLDTLVVRSILPGGPYWEGQQLDTAARALLTERIRAKPHLFVAQAPSALSTAPVLEDGRLVPRPVMLRGFVVAENHGYRVMPGGLARISSGLDTLQLALQKGGISKDWWVMAPTPQRHVSLLRQAHGPIVVTRDGSDLPSRLADNLFWLGRYSERLDSTTRLLREALGRLLEWEQDNTDERCLDDLFQALEITVPPVAESPRARFFALRQPLLDLVLGSTHPGSLQAIFGGMSRTGRAVRNHLGDDSWRLLNRLQHWIQEPSPNMGARQARELLEEELMVLTAFCGLNNETMPHHQGWLFFDIGRYLERVLHTLNLFKLAFITARHPGVPLWEVVLTITDNLTAYRRRYRSALHPTAIIDLLLFDEGNPRSVGYQLRRLQRNIGRLQQPKNSPYRSAEERLILQATTTLQLADIKALATLSHDSTRSSAELSRLLDDVQEPVLTLSDAITHSHFSHAEVPQQLITMQP
ncbi:MAG TPA: circularly permuted type 2 ATP-grasp protein [Candidatus Competibacteraceae bacterium]|nr:circularly permuted type 2 ATP-grasp protein [Candidatus Competibacteraceae bacterium]HQA26666.1 circularly permuted type 2 ATP-grasp protein [Candidatus Competibacteraceae bacterium]HQD56754.1 circularly permuted type 2 ATP-grasp protein [Candidatus Competibacteraceae bacterium]